MNLKIMKKTKLFLKKDQYHVGKVKLSDLKIVWIISVVTMIIINMFYIKSFIFFTITLVYGLLMCKDFFLKKYIENNIILTLVTHNPVVIILNLYLLSVFCNMHNLQIFNATNMLIVSFFWFPGLIYEFTRKIKSKEEETRYETYSKIFGSKKASIIALVVITIQLLLLMYINNMIHLKTLFISLFIVIYCILFGIYMIFIHNPIKENNLIKKCSQVYVIIFVLLLLILNVIKL